MANWHETAQQDYARAVKYGTAVQCGQYTFKQLLLRIDALERKLGGSQNETADGQPPIPPESTA